MDPQEREKTISSIQEELKGYFSWLVEELGEEYYIGEKEGASFSLEEEAGEIVTRRSRSERVHFWERDRYAFFQHPDHASVYKILEQEDLEIVHYPEELTCEHYKILETFDDAAKPLKESEKRYDQPFGVLLASQSGGWMYRLDFCDVCGLIEIWSMEFNQDEVALYT